MKTTISKTIAFKQRDEDKKALKSKYKINNTYSNNSFKVIPYPKYKKKKEKGIKLVKNNKPLLIVLGLVMFFSLLSFIDNRILKDKYGPNGKPIKSEMLASSTLVSETEFSSYSKIIESKIKEALHLNAEYTIATKTMHKNGSLIYAQGDISLEKSGNASFDVVLKNKKPYSLVINGTEYIK